MSDNKWSKQASDLLMAALEDDSLSELMAAFSERAEKLYDDSYERREGLKRYKSALATLKRHGKEEAQHKQRSYLMMIRSVFEYAAKTVEDWRVYRDETRQEHQQRIAKEELEQAQRQMKYKQLQFDQASAVVK